MRRNFIIFIFYSLLSLCTADEELSCESFDENTHSITYYCSDFVKFRTVDVQTETFVHLKSCLFDKRSLNELESPIFNLEIAGCANQTLRNVINELNSTLRTLDVSYSGYKTMDSLNFVHNQLEKINISHNQLTDHPWSNYLDFFGRFPKLRELDLSHNNLHAVYSFANRSIIKLKRLHFQHNVIAFIQNAAFVNLTELEFIDLSHNRLDRINANAFSNLQNLRKLHIENNPIEFFFCDDLLNTKTILVYMSWHHIEYFSTNCQGIVPSQSSWLDIRYFIASNTNKHGFFPIADGQYKIDCDPESFQRIRTFEAGRNKYAAVLNILKCFGSTLVELDISGNFIGALEPATFQRFVNLYELSLRNTQLLSFDFQMLQQQHQLTTLDISENRLTNINNILLSWNLKELQEFTAAGNRFKADLLQQLPSTIKYLDLSDSNLNELTPKHFQHLPALEDLRLKKTMLKFSKSNPFEALNNLRQIDISYNNLNGVNLTRIASTLEKLQEFRAVECQISNSHDLIGMFGLNLWTLDLSGNFVGDLYVDSPLHRLNLLHLYLNRANITHFDLRTLKESSNLAYFQVEYNQLTEIDFTPLAGGYLLELNLSGNKLNVVKNLTSVHFPKLRFLNISENQLSCEVLTQLNNDWMNKLAGFEHSQMNRANCEQLNEDDEI